MNFGLMSRGVPSQPPDSNSSTPTSHTYSTISEESLQVPPLLHVHNVVVNPKAVRGSGSYGTVYVACWHHSKVAAKKLHEVFFEQMVTPESKTGILRSFAREVNMLTQLKHPNIVQFYGLYSPRHDDELTSDTYLIQELMHCALDDRIRQSPRLTVCNVVDLAMDVVGGLRYLHEREVPIIHRDLASKNILLSAVGVAKIADLGVAKIMDKVGGTPQSRLPGTELYMPPEVKIEGMAYDTRVDIYSFGVVVLEMAIGRDAKANEAFRVGANRSIVLTPEVDRRREDFETLGQHPLRSVILSCLASRETRPTAKIVSDQLSFLCSSPVYQNCPIVPVIATESRDDSRELLDKQLADLQKEKELLQKELKSKQRASPESVLDRLMCENASLQSLLAEKEAQLSQLVSRRDPQLTQKPREDGEAATLRKENYYLRQQLLTGGPASLPEQLPSFASERQQLKSGVSVSADQLETLTISPESSAAELRRLKRQLDKYKSVNVELDQKLKEARLEMQKYNGRAERSYRLELEQVRSECQQLQGQLDMALRENSHLQSQLGAALARRY